MQVAVLYMTRFYIFVVANHVKQMLGNTSVNGNVEGRNTQEALKTNNQVICNESVVIYKLT
jgi:hypothetical protein